MRSQRWKEELAKTTLLFSRTLEPDEWEVWRKFLEHLPSQAVSAAFDNWQRNGRFFPKPKEILDLIETYKHTNQVQFKSCGKCDSEGWITVTQANWRNMKGELVPMKPGNKAVTRCDCWLAWRRG